MKFTLKGSATIPSPCPLKGKCGNCSLLLLALGHYTIPSFFPPNLVFINNLFIKRSLMTWFDGAICFLDPDWYRWYWFSTRNLRNITLHCSLTTQSHSYYGHISLFMFMLMTKTFPRLQADPWHNVLLSLHKWQGFRIVLPSILGMHQDPGHIHERLDCSFLLSCVQSLWLIFSAGYWFSD